MDLNPFSWLGNWIAPYAIPDTQQVTNPDYLAAQAAISSGYYLQGNTVTPQEVASWPATKPGETIITGAFAGVPMPQEQIPEWWLTGAGMPTNTQALGAAVMPYNPQLGSQIQETGQSALAIPNLLAGVGGVGLIILAVLLMGTSRGD